MTGVLPRSPQVENLARQALTGLALRPSDTQLQELAASHHIPLEALAAARWALFDQASGAVAPAAAARPISTFQGRPAKKIT